MSIKAKRVSHNVHPPHSTYLGQQLKSCPSCGARVHLIQIEYVGLWECESCKDHFLYMIISNEPKKGEPVMYTPREIAEMYPPTANAATPRDYMFDRRCRRKIRVYEFV